MNERIKSLRKALGLTQQEFADKLGISRGNIGAYEVGKNAPSDAVISLIVRIFNTNENWLRTGEGEMFTPIPVKDEIGYFVEDLLDYDGKGNPFYDMIIEMMKDYHDLDEKSKKIIRDYFKKVSDGIKKEKD